jgi:5-methylcytosine-specific restriction endonuclease McrA
MPVVLTREQELLHKSAVKLCVQYRSLEWPIIEILQKVDRSKLYLSFELTSLFQYAVRVLGLSEAVAYSFIAVGRKAKQISELKIALSSETLSCAKASRMVSVLNRQNAAAMIAFAATASRREIDQKVAEMNPRAAAQERVRPVAPDVFEIRTGVSQKTFDLLKRSQDLLARKTGRSPTLAETLEFVLGDFVRREDPVEKAERAIERKLRRREPGDHSKAVQGKLCPDRVATAKDKVSGASSYAPKRVPLTADQKHQVATRDAGRCTHLDSLGRRCDNQRWLQVHHIRPVSCGGGNDSENLTTLCSSHHDLVHQLSLPIEGQVTWLRSPRARYASVVPRIAGP